MISFVRDYFILFCIKNTCVTNYGGITILTVVQNIFVIPMWDTLIYVVLKYFDFLLNKLIITVFFCISNSVVFVGHWKV